MKVNNKYLVIDTNVIVSAFLFENSTPRLALNKAQDMGTILLSIQIFSDAGNAQYIILLLLLTIIVFN